MLVAGLEPATFSLQVKCDKPLRKTSKKTDYTNPHYHQVLFEGESTKPQGLTEDRTRVAGFKVRSDHQLHHEATRGVHSLLQRDCVMSLDPHQVLEWSLWGLNPRPQPHVHIITI